MLVLKQFYGLSNQSKYYVYRKMAGYKLSHMFLMRQKADLTDSPKEFLVGRGGRI